MTAPDPAVTVLSAQDAGYLQRETATQPMTVVTYGLVAARPDGTSVSVDDARRYVASRIHLVPWMRRRLDMPPLGLGPVRLVDDHHFELDRHVRAWPGTPASESDIAPMVAALTEGPLERDLPLWRLWVSEPLPDGRVAVGFAWHHALMDGDALIELNTRLFGREPHGWIADPPPWTPAAGVRTATRLTDAARGAVRQARRAVAAIRHGTGPPGAGPLRPVLAGPVGRRRRVGSTTVDLGVIKAVGKAAGATVNDVFLSIVAGGLRTLLAGRGPLPATPINALVPRAGATEGPVGNTAWTMYVPLPVEVADPIERLGTVAAETAERKRSDESQGAAGYAWDLSVSNVRLPGPDHLAGAAFESWLAAVPLQGTSRLAVVGLSYCGRFTVTITADADAFPDLAVLVAGLEDELARLADALGVDHGAGPS